jgi:mitochondrial fission protein ELM1
VAPSTWIIVSDKQGDNGQVESIVESLNWPCEKKYVHMLPQYVQGKPRHKATLDHIDLQQSSPLEAPWPDLILTVGRRPSMVALWVKKQSGNRTKIVLVGKPTAHMMDFSLVIASAINQLPPMPNYLSISLPLMRMDVDQVAAATQQWRDRLQPLPQPLIGILVGGKTSPFVMNDKVARDLVKCAQWVIDELGGTPYITTSRRTSAEVVDILRDELPARAKLFEWSAQATENPYRALLGTADGFIVTGDSVSMMVEVIYLRKPLAIFPLPLGWLGLDQYRRSFAHWLFNPKHETSGDKLRHRIARGVYYIDFFKLLCATRDFRAFHQQLVDSELAVWSGASFRHSNVPLPDDIGLVVERINALFSHDANN